MSTEADCRCRKPVYCSDEEYFEDKEEMRRYYKEVKESEGFDIGPLSQIPPIIGMIIPLQVKDTERIKFSTQLGIDHYNNQNNASLQLVKIVKVNGQNAAQMTYYITFEAKDTRTGHIGTYQSLVDCLLDMKDSIVQFTRLKPEENPKAKAKGTEVKKHDVEEEKDGKRELEGKEEKQEKKLKCC